jgi:hypothetical protein
MKAPAQLYRPLLKKALSTAWFHRELWPLAAVAGILGTGTAVNDILAQMRNTALSSDGTGGASNDVYTFFHGYFTYFSHTDIGSTIGSFLILFGIGIFLTVLLLSAQHAILRTVHRAANNKQKVSARELLNEASHVRFRRLFVLNAFFKILTVNILLVTGFLLTGLNGDTVVADALFGVIFSIFALALIFSLNIIGVYSIINVTKDNDTVTEALEEALERFMSHPLVSLEMSVLMFGLNFLFTVLYLAVILMAATPLLALLNTAIQTGNILAVSTVSVFSLILLLTFTISFAGFITTFTYSAWTELTYKIKKAKKVPARLHLHGKRAMSHFSKAS